MTKGKMRCMILAGILVLFFCATLMNYLSAASEVSNQMQVVWNFTYGKNILNEYDENFADRRLNDFFMDFSTGCNPTTMISVKPAYVFAMIDNEGNVLFKSESGVWWAKVKDRADGYNYISLEEYLTDDIRNGIIRMQKKSKANNVMIMLDSMELNFDGEKYRPVSITLNFQRGYKEKFILSDLEVTETVGDSSTIMFFNLYDIDKNSIDHKYYVKLQKKLDEAIENYEYDATQGDGGYSTRGEHYWEAQRKNFAFFYYYAYNPFYKTVTSEMFLTLTGFMTVLFGIITIIILFVASKLYDRQKNLEMSKRAFISAAAHELKTPLAVIQNQCECVLDGINPEKNGEYVKSVYDEALRMNSIVMQLLTFNRISDLTDVKKEKCNLSLIVREEISKYRNFAESKGTNLTEDIEDDVFTECNGELVAIAIDNHLSNAIKYATGEKHITVTLKKDSKGFIFCVYNDFDGNLPTEDMWNIFTRADKARNSTDKSTGMGLPINKKIFELHNYRYSHKKTKNGIVFSFQN